MIVHVGKALRTANQGRASHHVMPSSFDPPGYTMQLAWSVQPQSTV
jgi:hypothetical protein